MSRLSPLLLAASGAALLVLSAPSFAKSGSGGDATPDDKIEDKIEDDIEDDLEDKLEDDIEDDVRDDIEDDMDDDLDDEIEDELEDRAEDDHLDKSEDHARDSVEQKSARHEDRAADGARDVALDQAKADFEAAKDFADTGRDVGRTEARAARDAALAAPGADEEAIDAAYKEAVKAADLQRDTARDAADADYRAALNDIVGGNSGHGSNDDGDVLLSAARHFEGALDANGDEIARGEWLVLATPEEIDAISRRGFAIKSVEPLGGLGVSMARLEAPARFDLKASAASIREGAPEAEIDYNHVFYFPNAAESASARRGDAPSSLMRLARASRGRGLKIGVIDTAVDGAHATLKSAHLVARDFVPYATIKPADHGTAVVSILAGEDGGYLGLAPMADIIAASVFFEGAGGRASATTESLVRALDWMAEMKAPIVSMSLAGPPNAILEGAITRATKAGVTVVAAAGNEGPAARPAFPAAYADAVAVTAVAKDGHVYRLANRGDYVDIAAPGVAVRHARKGGGYASSSGTSMAAPFVAAALADLRRDGARSASDAVRMLMDNAQDLGAPGKDPVYGAGLVRPVEE